MRALKHQAGLADRTVQLSCYGRLSVRALMRNGSQLQSDISQAFPLSDAGGSDSLRANLGGSASELAGIRLCGSGGENHSK